MKYKLIFLIFLVFLIPFVLGEINDSNSTEPDQYLEQNSSANQDNETNEEQEAPLSFNETNNSEAEVTNITLPDKNQTEINDTNITLPNQNQTVNNTNITLPEENQTINNTNVTLPDLNVSEVNQSNLTTIILDIMDFVINIFAEGLTYIVNLFTVGSQGTLTSGVIYEARFLLTGTQIGSNDAEGSVYRANVGFFENPEQINEPILTSTFVSPSNGKTITQGDISVTFVVNLENTGGANATNITFSMDLPSQWGIVSGADNNTNGTVILDSEFNLTVGESIQKVLEVSIPENATTGNFALIAHSIGYNESSSTAISSNRLINDSVIVTVTTQYPAPVPPPGPAPSGGGGGSPGATCTSNWTCTRWTACSDGIQTRTCTDSEECFSQTERPLESRNCSIEGALFDLNVDIIERELDLGEPVSTVIEILNFGTTGAFNIILDYEIIDSVGNIIYSDQETTSVGIQKQFNKIFEIPGSEGEHTLFINLTHSGQIQPVSAEDSFIVIVPERVFAPFAILEAERIRGFFSGLSLVIFLGSIFLLFIILALRRHYAYMKGKLKITGKGKLSKKVKVLEKEDGVGHGLWVFRDRK